MTTTPGPTAGRPMTPGEHAAADQAIAAAKHLAPKGAKIVDTRSAFLTLVVDEDGTAHLGGTTRDWQWCAETLRRTAAKFDELAAQS